jgi:anti-sigma B factor antagonist
MPGADRPPERRVEYPCGSVGTRSQGDVTHVLVSGDLDMLTAARVRLAIEGAREATPTRVALDLSDVEFIDSHGLELLVTTHRSLAADGCSLSVTPPSDGARRVFTLTGLDWLFDDQPAADTALAAHREARSIS